MRRRSSRKKPLLRDGDRYSGTGIVEDDGAIAPCEHAGQTVRADWHDGIVIAHRHELLAGAECVHKASSRHAGSVGRRGRFRGDLRPYLDAALVDQHIHVLVAPDADFELRTDRPHHGIARMHKEWPGAVVGHLEMRLAFAQIDLPDAAT